MGNFEFGQNREEKIDKFLDNLAWRFSTKPVTNYTASAIDNLNKKLDELNENIKKADESSVKLANVLNRLTFWGVFITAIGVFAGLIQILYKNQAWPFIQ